MAKGFWLMGSKQSTESKQDQGGEPVLLNVYEPPRGSGTQVPGFGAFHTGVEVFGGEYSFSDGGINRHRTKWAPGDVWRYKETIKIGTTKLTKSEVQDAANEMKREMPGSSYDLVNRNCNHFSDAFCKRITQEKAGIPGWVNRAARMGSTFGVSGSSLQQKQQQQGGGGGGVVGGEPPQQLLPQQGPPPPVQTTGLECDLRPFIAVKRIGCLNQNAAHDVSLLFPEAPPKRKDIYLESDVDPQLLLHIPFSRAVRVSLIQVGVSASALHTAPKTIKLFINAPNLDFSDAESRAPTQVLTISEQMLNAARAAHVSAKKKPTNPLCVDLTLQVTDFANVNHMTVFVSNNHGAPTSIITKLMFVGKPK